MRNQPRREYRQSTVPTLDKDHSQFGKTSSIGLNEPKGNLKSLVSSNSLLTAKRIELEIEELLNAKLANNHNKVDAHYCALFKLGLKRERADERVLYLWAERHSYDISPGGNNIHVEERRFGEQRHTQGLRQQLPGFGIDKELHLLVADASAGKSTAAAELATVYSTRDRGFLDQEAPRNDPEDDPRSTVLIIASDGDGSAYAMWEDYLDSVNANERGASIVIWAQDDERGERPWNMSLPNLERLASRLEKGDICAVIIDTANAVFRGAGLQPGIGPIEEYLRLLKQIVCKHSALWILHHTNRTGNASVKGIGGHAAFQEVPSVIHMIESRPNGNGEKLRVWHVLKLRGSDYRSFSYGFTEEGLRVTEGHYYVNCADQVLGAIAQQHAMKAQGITASTSAAQIIAITKRPNQSVYNAIQRLKQEGMLKRKGTGYLLTARGTKHLDSLRVASKSPAPPSAGTSPDW